MLTVHVDVLTNKVFIIARYKFRESNSLDIFVKMYV